MSKFTRITSDSREVIPGCAFVAIRGSSQDGHAYLKQVIEAGAAQAYGEEEHPELGASYIKVSDSRLKLAELASEFYKHPSRKMRVLGVTGTSGKTTSTYFLESIFQAAGEKVGVIGTVNFRFGSKIYPSTHTTPGPVDLQKLLSEMQQDGCTTVIMEVSSHALSQKRVHGVAFDGVLFTNLTPEHLDFHRDMEDYFGAKSILFTELMEDSKSFGKNPIAIINADEEYGRKLISKVQASKSPVQVYPAQLGDHRLKIDFSGIHGEIVEDKYTIEIHSPLTGKFNAHNLLGAVLLARALGAPTLAISKGVAQLHCVPGRLERVEHSDSTPCPYVLVDYAHKPDALEKVLYALRELRASSNLNMTQKIITVFGCGGDRDKTKRPVMGKLAVELSDYVVVTSDNPRSEDPSVIIQEILSGTAHKSNFEVEPDRKKAIYKAIKKASPGDLVLIAGKGHEDYQIILSKGETYRPGARTVKIHFDDREVAKEALVQVHKG